MFLEAAVRIPYGQTPLLRGEEYSRGCLWGKVMETDLPGPECEPAEGDGDGLVCFSREEGGGRRRDKHRVERWGAEASRGNPFLWP